jgi:hypothetical protein
MRDHIQCVAGGNAAGNAGGKAIGAGLVRIGDDDEAAGAESFRALVADQAAADDADVE